MHCSSSSAFYLGEGVSILAHIPQISLCLSFSFHSDRNKSHFMPSKPTWPIHHEHAGSELHSHPRVSRNALSYCNQNILARKCKLSEWRDTTRSGGRGATTSSHIAPERCWNVTVIWRSSFIHRRTTLSKKKQQSSLYKPAVCVQQLTCQVCRRAQDIVGNVYAAVPPV